ncbi:MAG: hypothetical protein HC927_04555, partial [Deltaproteobacteria bacterium]|nr:hypothetical protein [Deltaproteobacteria bacterium]
MAAGTDVNLHLQTACIALLGSLACGDPKVGGEPIAKLGDEVLTREVIEEIAAREGIDDAAAREQAL